MNKPKGPGKAAGKTAGKVLGSTKKSSLFVPRVAGSHAAVDLDIVRELAKIATEFDLAEVEAEPSGRIRVCRRAAGSGGGVSIGSELRASGPTPLSLIPNVSEAPDDSTLVISSPFVGTFYASPSPQATPYIEVGQMVRKGQVVCIVEAMKLMNEIESEIDGKIVEILVKSGAHVEYGQALFRAAKP
jgi:acetyl-CoA carboxylase biotin carboxyl carrier protein